MYGPQIADFIQTLRFEKRYSSNTLLSYRNDLDSFFSYCLTIYDLGDPVKVHHHHIRSWIIWLKEQGMKPASINRKISSLRSFYKYLRKNGLVKENPLLVIRLQKKEERLPKFLKETETSSLLQSVFSEGFKGLTEELICTILYDTGMRRNELLTLKENEIEWSLSQLRVTGKGNKERLIPVHNILLEKIATYITEKKKLFGNKESGLLVTENGGMLYPNYIYRVVRKYLTPITTSTKKSPHTLRHSFATHLLNQGANIQAIKELLGHSSLAATQIYAHNNIERLREIHQKMHPRG